MLTHSGSRWWLESPCPGGQKVCARSFFSGAAGSRSSPRHSKSIRVRTVVQRSATTGSGYAVVFCKADHYVQSGVAMERGMGCVRGVKRIKSQDERVVRRGRVIRQKQGAQLV